MVNGRDISMLAAIRRPSWSSRSSSYDPAMLGETWHMVEVVLVVSVPVNVSVLVNASICTSDVINTVVRASLAKGCYVYCDEGTILALPKDMHNQVLHVACMHIMLHASKTCACPTRPCC